MDFRGGPRTFCSGSLWGTAVECAGTLGGLRKQSGIFVDFYTEPG